MRLFVAVTPPPHVLDHLDAAADALRAAAPDLSWIPRQNWHVTLAFLGEVGTERLAELSTRFERVAHRHLPMRLRLAGGGAFSRPAAARVLWAGVTGERAALTAVATSIQVAARKSGVPVDEHVYRPHLTVARSRVPADLSAAVARLRAYEGMAFSPAHIDLVRSHLGQGDGGRAVHEVVDGWPLRTRSVAAR